MASQKKSTTKPSIDRSPTPRIPQPAAKPAGAAPDDTAGKRPDNGVVPPGDGITSRKV